MLGRAAPAPIFWLNRQQILQDTPFQFSKIAPAQIRLQKAALKQSAGLASSSYWAATLRVRPLAEIKVF